MRTTIDQDDDLIEVARQLAAQQHTTMSVVISALLRRAMAPRIPVKTRNGVPLFAPKPGAKLPSLTRVNRLRDDA